MRGDRFVSLKYDTKAVIFNILRNIQEAFFNYYSAQQWFICGSAESALILTVYADVLLKEAS